MVLRSYHEVVLFTVLPYRNGKPQKQDSTPQLAIVSRLRIRFSCYPWKKRVTLDARGSSSLLCLWFVLTERHFPDLSHTKKKFILQGYCGGMQREFVIIWRLRFHYDNDTRTTIKYRCRIRYVFVHKEMNDSSLPFRRLLQRKRTGT